jgi:purine-binding chemotaxis protein CheW
MLPDFVRGVLNLLGVMVPIVDLRCRCGGGLTEATPLHVVIIVQIEDQQVGLLADRVLDIVAFETPQVQPVPQVSRNSRTDFLSGLLTIEGGMIAMININQLLHAEQDEPLPDAAA